MKDHNFILILTDIDQFYNLVNIDICFTKIKTIPREMYSLTNIDTLSLYCNNLTNIHNRLKNIKALQDLEIFGNPKISLVDILDNCPIKLKWVCISGKNNINNIDTYIKIYKEKYEIILRRKRIYISKLGK